MKLVLGGVLSLVITGIVLAGPWPPTPPPCQGADCGPPHNPPPPPWHDPLPPYEPPPWHEPQPAPEIDPGSAGTALALLSGVALILRSRGK